MSTTSGRYWWIDTALLASKFVGDSGQHRQQRRAIGGSEQLVEARFVLGRDEPLRPRQHRLAPIGQNQGMRAAIVGRAYPRAQIAAFQAVEHRHEIRPKNSERAGDFGL